MAKFEALPPFAVEAFPYFYIGEQISSEHERSTIVLCALAPEGVRLFFRVDGIILFDFTKSPAYAGGGVDDSKDTGGWQYKYRIELQRLRSKYVNAFLPCLYSGVRSSGRLAAPMSNYDYIRVSNFRGQMPDDDAAAWVLQSPTLALWPVQQKSGVVVSLDELIEGLAVFGHSDHDKRQEFYDLLGLLYRAGYDRSKHNVQSSLALSWVAIEKCQSILWEDFIKGGYKTIASHTSISGDRKKNFLKSRDYTASVRSQILSLCGVYSDEMLQEINKVRSVRNDFMHDLVELSDLEAGRAVHQAMQMVSRILRSKVFFQSGPTSWDQMTL